MPILGKSDQEDKINLYIRNRIKEARAQRDESQLDIARILSKTGSVVSDIERGRVQVSASDLSLIANYLEKPISYFYPALVRGADPSALDPDELELIHFYRQIGHNAAMRKLALQQVKNLADTAVQADREAITDEATSTE